MEKKTKNNQPGKVVGVEPLVIKNLAGIAEDIIKIKVDKTDTIKKLNEKFYAVMRRHGIRKYTRTENGSTGDNFEWTICKHLFLDIVKEEINWQFLLTECPKDLRYYEPNSS